MKKFQLSKRIGSLLPQKKVSLDKRELRKSGIGLLVEDERWDRLFSTVKKSSSIIKTEKTIRDCLGEKTRLQMERNINQAEKQFTLNRIIELTGAGNASAGKAGAINAGSGSANTNNTGAVITNTGNTGASNASAGNSYASSAGADNTKAGNIEVSNTKVSNTDRANNIDRASNIEAGDTATSYAGAKKTVQENVVACEAKIREIDERDSRIQQRSDELEIMINKNNYLLLENAVSYLYQYMINSQTRVSDLDDQIADMRDGLKKRIDERATLAESVNETYNFLHGLLGAKQIESLDIHYTLE